MNRNQQRIVSEEPRKENVSRRVSLYYKMFLKDREKMSIEFYTFVVSFLFLTFFIH